jgi:hypothetical protein
MVDRIRNVTFGRDLNEDICATSVSGELADLAGDSHHR